MDKSAGENLMGHHTPQPLYWKQLSYLFRSDRHQYHRQPQQNAISATSAKCRELPQGLTHVALGIA
ncbi:MAG: hypothetical protein AAF827_17885 [Cyanobacteria bacterium P01_D01_bin.6]